MAVLVYKALNGLAPRYLGPLTRVADLPGRRALRSAGSNRLHIPHVRLPTVDTRVFSVLWNKLPDHITSAGSLHTFCHRLNNNNNKFAQSNLGTGPRRGSCVRRWLA